MPKPVRVSIFRLLKTIVICFGILALPGCDKELTSTLDIKPLPPAVELNLAARAVRINRDQVRLDLSDDSPQALKVLELSLFAIDRAVDGSGQEKRATVRDCKWGILKPGTYPGIDSDTLQVSVLINELTEDKISHIEGTFAIRSGSYHELSFSVEDKQHFEEAEAKLAGMGILTSIKFTLNLKVILSGEDVKRVSKLALINGTEPPLAPSTLGESYGSDPKDTTKTWGWGLPSDVSPETKLAMWLKSDDQEGEPSWQANLLESINGKSEPAPPIRFVGRVTWKTNFQVMLKGPKSVLIGADWDESQGANNTNSQKRDLGLDRIINLSGDFDQRPPNLKVQIIDDVTDATIAYNFDNLEVANAP
ncbi:MAG: hypothetical protein KDB03_19970 [Planctomycetales bacterium]|nr:hypothetical protein [Planctomycetales bacterium]